MGVVCRLREKDWYSRVYEFNQYARDKWWQHRQAAFRLAPGF